MRPLIIGLVGLAAALVVLAERGANLLGETSTPHPGPAAKDSTTSD